MTKAGRLVSAADFRRTYAEGKRASTGSVVVHVRVTDEDRPARVGVATGRGIGGSVERNRAKRRLREAVRTVRPDLRTGADVVLVAAASPNAFKFQDMVDSVRRALSKAGGCR